MRLASERFGEGHDLVLLHGWGMNAGVWAPLREQLSAHWRVTAIELPGHGDSPFDAQRTRLPDWAGACLDAAPERALWLGWSLGGLLAQQAALLAPARLRGLLVVASTPCFVTRDGWPCAMDDEVFDGFASQLSRDGSRTLARFLALQVRGAKDAGPTLRTLRKALNGRPAPLAKALDAGLRLLLDGDLRARLPELAVPNRWLFGQRDALVPVAAADCIAGLLPCAGRQVLAGAGHAPFLSHPESCLQALQEFDEVCDV